MGFWQILRPASLKSEKINLYCFSFRKKNESLNYLRMSSKVDATSSRWKKLVFDIFLKIEILFYNIKQSWLWKHSQLVTYKKITF